MNRFSLIVTFITLFLSVVSMAQPKHEEPKTLAIGVAAPDFNLKGTDGKTYSLKSFSKAKVLVVIFNANHCPTAQAYEDRMIAITKDYASKEVKVVVISSNNPDAVNLSELGYTDLSDTYPRNAYPVSG